MARADPARDSEAREGSEKASGLTVVATVIAVGLLAAYLVLVFIQWQGVDDRELPFARRSELLKGLEALAFAAAGALLGTTVQRQVTKKAEDEARQAKGEAKENQAAAEKAKAVHTLVEVKARTAEGIPAGAAGDPLDRGSDAGRTASDLDEILQLARRYDEPSP